MCQINLYLYWIQVWTQTWTYQTRFKRFRVQVHQSSGPNLVVKVWVWLKRAWTRTELDRGQSMTVTQGFFQNTMYPKDFYHCNSTFGFHNLSPNFEALEKVHFIQPGQNNGTGNYVLSTTDLGLKGRVCTVIFAFYTYCNMILPDLCSLHETGQHDTSLALS